MSYIHGRSILLRAVIGMGIVFSLATSSNVHCAPGMMDEINKLINGIDKTLDSAAEHSEQHKQTIKATLEEISGFLKDMSNDSITGNYSEMLESLDVISKNLHLNENLGEVAQLIYEVLPKYHTGLPSEKSQSEDPEMQQVCKDIAENMSIPQILFDQDDGYIDDDYIHKSTNNNNSHSDQAKTRNKRDVQYNPGENSFNKDEDHIKDEEHIYAEIGELSSGKDVDVPDQSNDSSNENNSDKSSEGIYVNMERQSSSKDAVDAPDQSNDSSNENNSDKSSEGIYVNMERQSSSKDAVDAPPSQSNGRNDKHNSNQDADDDIPNNNIIADENNQLSNTSNLKKAITHEDHATVLQSLFNSTNNIVSQRAVPRLTTDNLDQTIEGQASSLVVSQKLVSSGSNMSNVQHEVWIMPLIKKGEKYVDNVRKYTINTYGVNIGFDSKIPHYCRGNIESIVGIVFALYNSQLKHTASDSATLLNTYIISMYYSMIFNQKFFIYTLFSFGTSNAGNDHSATGVNNTTIYNPEPCSSYNAFRHSAELHAGYNIMVYDSKLHDRQIALMPTAGVQVDTLALHGNTKKHYSFVQQLKLSTGIKFAYHKRIKPSISIYSSLYGFVNYCTWSNTMTHNDQSFISNFENGTLVEKENLATSNKKLSYRIGGDASLQYNRVMYILRYEMNIAQDYLSHQIALKIKLKF